MEIWASPYPGLGGRWQLSNTGIVMVGSAWGERELLYSQDDGGIYSIPITISGDSLSPGSPALLFRNNQRPHLDARARQPADSRNLRSRHEDERATRDHPEGRRR